MGTQNSGEEKSNPELMEPDLEGRSKYSRETKRRQIMKCPISMARRLNIILRENREPWESFKEREFQETLLWLQCGE